MSVTVSLPTTRRLVALLAALALLAGLIPGLPLAKTGAQEAAGTTFISEIHYDNDGTDEGEFVEVTAPDPLAPPAHERVPVHHPLDDARGRAVGAKCPRFWRFLAA